MRMVLFLCIVVVLSGATLSRNVVWQDALSLSLDRAKKSPNKARVYNDLGNALDDRHFFEEAVRAYTRAIELDPRFQKAHFNLGLAYFRRQRYDDAGREFQAALSLEPSDTSARDYLAAIYEIKLK